LFAVDGGCDGGQICAYLFVRGGQGEEKEEERCALLGRIEWLTSRVEEKKKPNAFVETIGHDEEVLRRYDM